MELTKLNIDIDYLKEIHNKSLMRLIIVSMELERTTLQNNLLLSNVYKENHSYKNDANKLFEQTNI